MKVVNPHLLRGFACLLLAFVHAVPVFAGPFHEPGILAGDPRLKLWASTVVDYSPAIGTGSNRVSTFALGAFDGRTVSLGDLDQAALLNGQSSGSITTQLPEPIRNGPGWDLAVFENSFVIDGNAYLFAELGYVEVSHNGVDFARFPATSLTETRLDLGVGTSFSGIHPTDVHNLAGKHVTGQGTPFDLSDLRSSATVVEGDVNLNAIQFVRIVDIPGSPGFDDPLVDAAGNVAFPDHFGRPILDPWNTSLTGTGGFDLDAIGARYPARHVTWHSVPDDVPMTPVPEPIERWPVFLCLCAELARRVRCQSEAGNR